MFIVEWGHRTKFQTLPVDRVGGYFGQTLGAGANEAYGEYHDNNATSQLGWESKMEPSVTILLVLSVPSGDIPSHWGIFFIKGGVFPFKAETGIYKLVFCCGLTGAKFRH